ncbi:N-glycosylase/DNA lyase [archaeon]
MRSLRQEIKQLQASPVKRLVDKRIHEFKKNKDFFSELCFCLLTANTSAELGIKCQKECRGFNSFPEKKLAAELKSVGYRFYNRRAAFIVAARGHDLVLERDWLVKNVKGIGMKEASHFLRNIGFDDYAIIDFHILDLLARHKLIKKPKTLSKKEYLEIEGKLAKLAKATNLTLAELDLYLWYLETGNVLK